MSSPRAVLQIRTPFLQRVPVEANHLNTQVLVRYYEQEWDGINR